VHSLLESCQWEVIYDSLADVDFFDTNDVDLCFAFGRACRALGFPELGYQALARALELDRFSSALRCEALLSLVDGGEWELAKRVLADSPDKSLLSQPFLRWVLARCNARLGSPEIAESELLALQEEQSLDPVLLGIGLVEVNILLGDHQRASYCLDRLFALSSDCDQAFILQLELMRSCSVKDFSAQVLDLINRSPKSSRLFLQSADACAVWMHLDQADHLYRLGIEKFGWRGKIVNYFLDFLASRGELVELKEALARQDLRPYPEIAPQLLIARCLMVLGRHAEAESLLLQEARSLFRDSLMIEILKLKGEHRSALRLMQDVRLQCPADAHWSMTVATQLLALGHWDEGWTAYESRFLLKDKAIISPPGIDPVRSEESPRGKNVLVFGEQGFGDSIMMASLIPDLLKVAQSVTLFVQPRLAPLLQSSFPAASVISEIDADAYQSMDACYGLGSLGRFFRLSSADFPGTSYLSLSQEQNDHWRSILDSLGPGLKVGIAWRGGGHILSAGRRSIDLKEFAPILKLSDAHFVNLQYKYSASEVQQVEEEFGISIHHFEGITEDLLATAALTQALDLVITVQQTALHIAGAVGTPAWVLVPVVPEWRYGLSGSSMPWYGSVRLFRQTQFNDWARPIAELKDCFQELLLATAGQNGEAL